MFERYNSKESELRDKFIQMYNLDFSYVYSFIFARTAGDARAAEELAQETFAAAFVSMGSFSGKSTGRTWLCGIAKNKLKDYYRQQARLQKELVPSDVDTGEVSAGSCVVDVFSEGETRKNVIEALSGISPVYRHALVMKYLDGYSVKEIAGILKRTPKAVEGILQRAKAGFIKSYVRVSGEEDYNGG